MVFFSGRGLGVRVFKADGLVAAFMVGRSSPELDK